MRKPHIRPSGRKPLAKRAAVPEFVAVGLAAGALGLTGAAAQGSGQSAPPTQKVKSSSFEVAIPVYFEGREIGLVDTSVDQAGNAQLNRKGLAQVLGVRIAEATRQTLVSDASSSIDPEGLKKLGIEAAFDFSALRFDISIPVASRGSTSVRVADDRQGVPIEDFLAPEPFSGSLTLAAAQAFDWDRVSGAFSGPLEVLGQFSANLFGSRGVYLFSEFQFNEAAPRSFVRGNTLLVHDDPELALRFIVGDTAVPVAGFQVSPTIGGFSFGRSFTELQPFRNIRPGGRFRFTLDRPTTIDIRVNGTSLRQLRLDSGQYDLQDFPFLTGLNEIEIYSIDEYNQTLLTSFNQFFSGTLLNPDIDEFAISGGFPQVRSRVGTIEYLTDRPILSGFYRRGLSQHVTVGINSQVDRRTQQIGGEAVWSSPVGNFANIMSVSRDRLAGTGYQVLGGYELNLFDLGQLSNVRVDAQYRRTSANYRDLGSDPIIGPSNVYRQEVRGGLALSFPAGILLGLTGSYLDRRDRLKDEYRLGASLSSNFRGFSVSATFERTRTAIVGTTNRFLISVLRSLGRRTNARISYDTQLNTAQLQINRFDAPEVNSLGLEGNVQRTDRGWMGSGVARFNANRFQASVRHVASRSTGGGVLQTTSYAVASQIAFDGEGFAFGRPVGPSFAVVRTHPSLENRSVGAQQGLGRAQAQARSGSLGPALAPVGAFYSPQILSLNVDDLPIGYDIGKDRYDLFPGAASGYTITVGSDASRILIGTVVDAAGKPVGLQGGRFVSLDKTGSPEQIIFTNRAGRFSVEGVRPGRYLLTLGTGGRYRVELKVGDETQGLVNLGQVKAAETEQGE